MLGKALLAAAVALCGVSCAGASLPLFVCEYHQEVLAGWLQAKARGAFTGPATVVHFDSHPDMGVPPNAPGSHTFGDRARGVLKYVEIQNFILMAAHLGVVNKVYWVFNPWCLNYRFGDGPIDVTIGVRDGMLWLTAPPDAEDRLDYFREKQRGRLLPWSERHTLADTKQLKFQTVPTAQAAAQLKAGIGADEEVLLDIDEDYFATESIFAFCN